MQYGGVSRQFAENQELMTTDALITRYANRTA